MENKDYSAIENELIKLRSVKPGKEWNSKLKSLLLNEFTRAKETSTPVWKLALATGFILIFLGSGTFAYSQNALPGDPLYPLKRGYERIRLTLTPRADKFKLQQKLTEKRVDELKEVVLVRNDNASQAAISEVEESVSQIRTRIVAIQTQYQKLKEVGGDTTLAEKELKNFVPLLEETQKDLNQIEEALPQNKQLQIKKIRFDLNNLQNKIEAELDPSPKIEGIQDNQDGLEKPTLSPSP